MSIVTKIKRYQYLYYWGRVFIGYLRIFDKNFRILRKLNKGIFLLKNQYQKGEVLLAGSIGCNPDNLMQTIIGNQLKRMNYSVDVLFCDSELPICFNAKHLHYFSLNSQKKLIKNGQGKICDICVKKSKAYINSSKFNHLKYSNFKSNYCFNEEVMNNFSLEDFKKLVYKDINIGLHAFSATIRFFATTDLKKEKFSLQILKLYVTAAAKTVDVVNEVLNNKSYKLVICDHGIYVPQGIITEICKKKNINVLTFNTGYRKNSFLFASGDSYHFAIPRDITFTKKSFSNYQRKIANEYIESRRSGVNDWVYFQEKNSNTNSNVNFKNQMIAIFPNVLWDADIHFKESVFPDQISWINETLEFLLKETKMTIAIRIHPGEIKGFVKSRQSFKEIIWKKFKNSERVIIYGPSYPINSYILADKSSYSIVYGSKMGIDLAALGKKVVVAGDCWTREKGITMDPKTKIEYFNYLKNFLDFDTNQKKALDFAYYLYFEKMIDFDFIFKRKGDPPFGLNYHKLKDYLNNDNSKLSKLLEDIIN